MNGLLRYPPLYWLPPVQDFAAALTHASDKSASPDERFRRLRSLAQHELDLIEVRRLDNALTPNVSDLFPDMAPLRVALAGGATMDHLAASIRVGAVRRGLIALVNVLPFGQWRQQILEPESLLYASRPHCLVLAPDPATLIPRLPLSSPLSEVCEAVNDAIETLRKMWRLSQDRTSATIIQEVPWTTTPGLFGHFERRLPAAPGAIEERFRQSLADAALEDGVLLLDVPRAASSVGLDRVTDRALWHHAKQSISPAAAPWAGDHIARILAAVRGLSKKVLVLDLDNTLWGGVIGDDGLDGIALGQGSATGEAFIEFQQYVKGLAERGVILAVSSKNDPEIAAAAFREHPEMVLKLEDFAVFEVNWHDKPTSIRRIAEQLNLGIESCVFVDDNPAERDLMRRTLPNIAVPELPEAPELYAQCLADAGYFEPASFTVEDTRRNALYVANKLRLELHAATPDMDSFLRDLHMTLTVGPFHLADVGRITQLINKTNQFNVTSRRYTEGEVRALIDDPNVLTFAARLKDRFGDHGLISVIICRNDCNDDPTAVEIDTWLMSCRVLGRRVENAMLVRVAEAAAETGVQVLRGRLIPTPKNGLVANLYQRLGFTAGATSDDTGESVWELKLDTAPMPDTAHLKFATA